MGQGIIMGWRQGRGTEYSAVYKDELIKKYGQNI